MRNKQNDASLLNLPIVVFELIQAGSGKKWRREFVYMTPKRKKYSSNQRSIIYNFKIATIKGDVTKQITNKVDLFKSIMQQNVIKNKFNHEYAPLATIKQGITIEFAVKGANDLYLNLHNSRLHVLAMIKNAHGTNIDANTVGPINLTQQQMFCEIGFESNGRNEGETSQLNLYCSHLETLLNFCKETQQTCLLCEG